MKKRTFINFVLLSLTCGLLFHYSATPVNATTCNFGNTFVNYDKDTLIPPEFPWPLSPAPSPLPDTLTVVQ